MSEERSGTIRYLSPSEVAARIGLKSASSLVGYKLPEPDALIGTARRGWLPETIDAWHARRPGRGRPWSGRRRPRGSAD